MSSAAFQLPVATGNLDSYIRTVNSFPLLSEQEERDLGMRLRGQDDLDAARQLVLSHLRVVVAIARGYLGYGLPHADLIQEGNIGLMKAVKRYDPNRGVRLVSFAIHWIKAEIHEYVIRNWRMVKVATTKAQRKLFFNLKRLMGQTTLTPDERDHIAETLNVRAEDVREMEARLHGYDVALDPLSSERSEEAWAPIDYLAAEGSEPTSALEARDDARLQGEGLQNALASLDERSRRIIETRWLKEDGALTLHELATEYNISAERIRQIEARAMKTLRGLLTAPA